MAMVITVAQQKGGAGKTTLAANLASALAGHRKVALLDIDPQRSLSRWQKIRLDQGAKFPEIGFSDPSGWRLQGELDRLARDYDVVVIDSPPVIDSDAKIAIRAASLVLIPLQPSMPDLWAAEATLKLCAQEKRPVRIVMNRVSATSKLRDEILKALEESGQQALQSSLGNRAAYAQAFAKGLGVTEASPRSTAASEMRTLSEEVEALC
jgi:chromosome partitioning protein